MPLARTPPLGASSLEPPHSATAVVVPTASTGGWIGARTAEIAVAAGRPGPAPKARRGRAAREFVATPRPRRRRAWVQPDNLVGLAVGVARAKPQRSSGAVRRCAARSRRT